MIHDIHPEPPFDDSSNWYNRDTKKDRDRFSWEVPDGRHEPDWSGYQRVVHARRQARSSYDSELLAALHGCQDAFCPPSFMSDDQPQHQEQQDAPDRKTLPGPLAFICDMCSKPIRLNEEYYALEDTNFAGNKDKLYHERCIGLCPGLQQLLVKRVRLYEEGTVQPVEHFGNPISKETMEEVWFMMEQIEVQHYQNVFAQEDSDGDSFEADDNLAEAFGFGGPWCKFRCLIGLVIYFLTVYLTRINWSSMMPDLAQEATGLNYTDEPNVPLCCGQMKQEVPLFSDKCYVDDANFYDGCYAAQLVSDDRVTPTVVPE